MTLALRGRRLLLAGNRAAAVAVANAAAEQLAVDVSDDIGSLVNGAIALAGSAAVLAEVGFRHESRALVDRARARMSEAAVADPALESLLSLAEAAAARLADDPEHAIAVLPSVETSMSEDSAVRVARERARLAWDAGDGAGAAVLYNESVARSESSGNPSLARMISAERQSGPLGPGTISRCGWMSGLGAKSSRPDAMRSSSA